MTSEASVRTSLAINVGKLAYSRGEAFLADVSEGRGPTPGAVLATTGGVEVNLSVLTVPGLCRLENLDATNYVTYGILDSNGTTLHKLGELLPGESYVVRLSRDIGDGVGTGYESLLLKADTASCYVSVEAFEK